MSYARTAVTRMTLDISRLDLQRSETVTQGDTNRRWEVTLINGGAPFRLPPNWTAALTGIKPDGNGLLNGCSVVDGKIVYDFAAGKEIATCVGGYPVQLDIWDEVGELVASPKVYINVLADVRPREGMKSESEYGLLGEFIAQKDDLTKDIKNNTTQIGNNTTQIGNLSERMTQAEDDIDILTNTSLNQGDDITALKEKVTTAGTVTIHTTQWSYTTPHTAYMGFPSNTVKKGQAVLFIPLSDATKEAAAKARLSVGVDKVTDGGGDFTDYVLFVQAEEGAVPTVDLDLGYIVLRTAGDLDAMVALIGVDAYGEGGGTASGVDEEAVKKIITAMLGNVENERQYSAENPPPYPVTKVNGQTGEVNLPIPSEAADVKADPAGTAETMTAALRQEVNGKLADYDKSTAVNNKISSHNTSTESHADLRLELQRLADRLNAALNSDDTSLDDLKEIVAYIKSNKTLIDGVTASKVNVTDIVNNLVTNKSNVPLSAAQGVALKLLIDSLEEIVEGKTTAEQVAADIADALKGYQPKGDYLTTADAPAIINTEVNKVVTERKEELRGAPGKTPEAGVDYPTVEQVDSYIAAALAERNQLEPIVAESVDWLNENGDPTKVYIVPNVDRQGGKVYAYAEKTIVTEPEQPETPADVNVLEGMALRVGRYGSSGSWTSTGSYTNNRTTELIPCDDDDRITIENWLGGSASMYISFFDASQAWIGKVDLVRNDSTNQFSTANQSANSWADKTNYTYSATTATSKPLSEALGKTGIAYFTVCSADTNVDSNNQAINGYAIYVNKGSGSSTTTPSEPAIEIVPDWYAFIDFVPTDDARIDELNRAVSVLDTANTALNRRVDALEENGVTSGGATTISKAQALLKIRNWDKPIYERLTPFLLDADLTVDTTYPKTYTDSADSDGSKRRVNVQKVYDEYDALCTAHPDFVRDITDVKHGLLRATETTFGGLCSDGIQYVRVYEFCEREGRHSNTTVADNWSETKPTFVIVTGIHWEYNGVYSMLYALKEITENPELRDMRRNCRFIVIPMSNPYSFTAYQASGGGHYNANGVEIHNNFAVDFNNAIDATHGTAPLTEVETRYIDNALRKYRDTAVCLLSCHSNASKGANFIWGSVATKFMCNVSMRLVDMMSNAWDVKYDGTDGNYNYRELIDANKSNGSNPQDDGDYRCGFASLSTSSGTEAKQATLYGVQGINVEVYEWFYPFDPNGGNKLLAYSRGAETYINLLRLLAVTYDHNDRDKYAPNPAYEIEE